MHKNFAKVILGVSIRPFHSRNSDSIKAPTFWQIGHCTRRLVPATDDPPPDPVADPPLAEDSLLARLISIITNGAFAILLFAFFLSFCFCLACCSFDDLFLLIVSSAEHAK